MTPRPRPPGPSCPLRAAVAGMAFALAVAAVLAPLAGAQGAQPEQAPVEFQNGQENGFGRIAMEPYVDADGEPVRVEALVTLRDLDLLARTSNLLVAFNLHSDEASVTRTKLTAGDQTLQPVREATVRDGLQHQQFFDPADVLAEAEGGEVELRLSGLATAEADGQWHIGVLVIAFDSVWGTLRASDGGGAELYGFSLLMEHGAGGSVLAPFHGQGNEMVLLLPLFVAGVGAVAGGWLLTRTVRDRYWPRPGQPRGPHGEPLLVLDPAPAASVPSAMAVETVVKARPVRAKRRTEPEMWSMDFGYRLDPDGAPPLPTSPEPPPMGFAHEPAADAAAQAPLGPVQGPKLPPGMAPVPWRPTAMADDGEPETAPSTSPPAARIAAKATPTQAAVAAPKTGAKEAPAKDASKDASKDAARRTPAAASRRAKPTRSAPARTASRSSAPGRQASR